MPNASVPGPMRRGRVEPYVPSRCKYHPRRQAAVRAKLGEAPMVALCAECHMEAVREYERIARIRRGGET